MRKHMKKNPNLKPESIMAFGLGAQRVNVFILNLALDAPRR